MMASGQPVIFGEVLCDCFPDGQEVLGGAPFNVAWHLCGLGAQPVLVSAVGDDPRGSRIAAQMTAWGLSRRGLQVRSDTPTGVVRVTLIDGQPSFDIPADQAFDGIALDPALGTLAEIQPKLLYRGTLAARSRASRETLVRLAETVAAPIFVDLNLRSPWWSRPGIEEAVRGASWVKLNRDELAVVAGQTLEADAGLAEVAEGWRAALGLDVVVVTLGDRGALLVADGAAPIHAPAPPVAPLVDTIGAGDGFSAVCCLGLLAGWSTDRILQRAVDFAAALCRMRGATSADRDLYRMTRQRWQADGGTQGEG